MKIRLARFAAGLTILVFFLSTSTYAIEGSVSYTLDELDMTISIPESHVVFTRDTQENDPNFTLCGLEYDSFISMMVTGNGYLDAFAPDLNYEITVTMTDNRIIDFNLLSDTALDALTSTMYEAVKDYGYSIYRSEIYNHSQAKFVKLYADIIGESTSILQYYTIYNNKAINVTIRVQQGEIELVHEELMKRIVDSIYFGTKPFSSKNPIEYSAAYRYYDEKSPISFIVPVNWKEEPTSKPRETIDLMLISTEDNGLSIMFGSDDLYATACEQNEFSPNDSSILSREYFNNDILTVKDVAELYGVEESDVSVIEYNKQSFFIGEFEIQTNVKGTEMTLKMTNATILNDGFLYLFQFSGVASNSLYKDFVSILSSVEFS